jgi:hypothetical protein
MVRTLMTKLLDRLNWRYAARQFDPIRRSAPPTGNNLLTTRSAIFAACPSERNNNEPTATGENHRVTANLLTDMEQDHQKIENPRVHPGQPYNQGWWPDP